MPAQRGEVTNQHDFGVRERTVIDTVGREASCGQLESIKDGVSAQRELAVRKRRMGTNAACQRMCARARGGDDDSALTGGASEIHGTRPDGEPGRTIALEKDTATTENLEGRVAQAVRISVAAGPCGPEVDDLCHAVGGGLSVHFSAPD
jgi:hypothetical protein